MTDAAPPDMPEMTGVIPHLRIDGAAEASLFYQRAFSAREVMRMPAQDGKTLMHCHLVINGGHLMLVDGMPQVGHPALPPQGYHLHLHVNGVDQWWDQAIAAGCDQVMPLELMFWGDRYGMLKDPFGVTWALAETPGKYSVI